MLLHQLSLFELICHKGLASLPSGSGHSIDDLWYKFFNTVVAGSVVAHLRLRDAKRSRRNKTREEIMSRHFRNFIYYSQDWNVMERALLKARRKLHRAKGNKDMDRLARRVMTLFDQGLRDADVIARTAANQEILIANIASLRSTERAP